MMEKGGRLKSKNASQKVILWIFLYSDAEEKSLSFCLIYLACLIPLFSEASNNATGSILLIQCMRELCKKVSV